MHDGLRQPQLVFMLRGCGQGKLLNGLPPVDVAHPGGAEHVLAAVDGDAHQPRLFVDDLAVEQLFNVLIGPDERLLRGVFGSAHIVQVDAAHAFEAVAVLLHQPHEHGFAHVFCISAHRIAHLPSVHKTMRAPRNFTQ